MNRIAPILILSASLAACADEPPATSTEAPVAAEISSKKLTAEQHGKSTVPVFMAYEFLQTPAVGEPLTVRVELARASTIEAGALRVATRGAMTLSKNTPEQMPLKASASSGTDLWTQDIVVTPSDTGRSYVSIQVNGIWEGQPFTKAMSIPVQVGEGGPRLETNGVIIDDGVEVLSSMPADQQLETDDSTR